MSAAYNPLSARQIEALESVFRLGSMSAAARSLGVSQPFVSKLVRGAEERLGVVLFELRGGKLRASQESEAILAEICSIHERLQSVMRKAENLSRGHEGRLRIAALPGFVASIVPLAVARFRTSHPRVTFDIQSIVDGEILPVLAEYRADLVIGTASVSHEKLKTVALGTAEVGIFYRRDQRRFSDRVLISQLAGIDLIGSQGMMNLVRNVTRDLDLGGHHKTTVGSNQIAAALVLNGFDAAIIDSTTALEHDQTIFGFSRLSPEIAFEIRAFFDAERAISVLARDFVDIVANILR